MTVRALSRHTDSENDTWANGSFEGASLNAGCPVCRNVLISPLCAAAPTGAVTQLHAFTTEGNTLVSRLQHKGMYSSAEPIVGLGAASLLKCSSGVRPRPKVTAAGSRPPGGRGQRNHLPTLSLAQKHLIPESAGKTSAQHQRRRELRPCFIVCLFFLIQYRRSQ